MEGLKGKFSNFLARLVSAIFLVLIMVILLWWGDIPFLVGITVVIAVGLWEFYRTIEGHGYSPATFLAVPVGVALPVVSFFIKDTPQDLAPLIAILCGFLALTKIVELYPFVGGNDRHVGKLNGKKHHLFVQDMIVLDMVKQRGRSADRR